MGIIATLKQLFARKHSKSNKTLAEWQSLYQDLQSHPLTQAKIINEQLLQTTHEELEKVNKKLNNINERVTKLESEEPAKQEPQPKKEKASKKEVTVKEVVRVEKVVEAAHLSEQEQRIVENIKKQNEVDAETIAGQFNISRSNASLKLNKLYNWGLLDKRLAGKTVFYGIGSGKSIAH